MCYIDNNWNDLFQQEWVYPPVPKEVNVKVLTSNKPVRQYSHEGKTFIEGKNGSKFSIRIENPNSRRILAVVSVDGLSVIDGEKATLSSRGYILDGFASITLDGWRVNNEEIRRFFFTEKDSSYSAIKGEGEKNCGVISVAAYVEYEAPRVKYRHQQSIYNLGNTFTSGTANQFLDASNVKFSSTLSDDNSRGAKLFSMKSTSKGFAGGQSAASADAFNLGTGMGAREKSKVTESYFNRGNLINISTIYYTSREGLESIGIDVEKTPKVEYPQAFSGYCKEI